MQLDSKSYLTLNSWLQTADENYISGRILWMQYLPVGGSNLLWLSCEQLIKILLLQNEINELSSKSENLDELHEFRTKRAKKLGSNYGHGVSSLVEELKKYYPDLNYDAFTPMLEKLNEYFFRRYAKRGGSSISLLMLDVVDRFYFDARFKVHPDVGLGLIDEIVIQKKRGSRHPLPAFSFAYLNNPYFKSRKHMAITFATDDGETFTEDGS